MSKQIARGARFRHIVFRGSTSGRRRRCAVNFAPSTSVPDTRRNAPALLDPFACRAPAHLSGDEAHFVVWLFEQAGMDATAYRPECLRRRLSACLRAVRAESVREARLRLENDPGLIAAAMNAMVIGVTGFFRDANVFDHLTHDVLPALPRRTGHPRVWSIGCSDGEELYSVAILLAEMGMLAGASLLGTDCRNDALSRARAGRYEQRVLHDVPPSWQQRWFESSGPADHAISGPLIRRVRDEIRAAIQWRRADVTQLREPGTWDLILCRNLAMYLRPEVASRLWVELENALCPGGFLVLGKAERPVGASRLGLVAPCIFRRDRV